MSEFLCKVTDERGQISVLTEKAESEGELRQRLTEKGLYPLSIRRRGGLPGIAPSFLNGRRRRLAQDEFLLFNQQFVTLVRAGLPRRVPANEERNP